MEVRRLGMRVAGSEIEDKGVGVEERELGKEDYTPGIGGCELGTGKLGLQIEGWGLKAGD